MDFDLAKELKDAGFPQGEPGFNGIVNIIDGKTEPVYFPTLEELIEACGDDFHALIHVHKSQWDALSETVLSDGSNGRAEATPQEAVAKLWLALNAHSQTEKSS